MRRFVRRLWYVIRQHRADADLAEEMEFHRAMAQGELESGGAAPGDARRSADRRFGNAALARNRARDVWIWPWLQDLAQDVRFATRLLAKEPRFFLAVVVALALGIAATNTVFTLVNAALFNDLPFDAPEQLVSLATRDADGHPAGVSYPDFQDWRASARTFSGMAASTASAMILADEKRAPGRFRGCYISAGAFELLRVKPALGRVFEPREDRPGAPPTVILGHDLWMARYGSDPDVRRADDPRQ